MKNIVIFYQVINREKESCENLKKQLETEKDITVYVLSIDFEHDLAIKMSKKIKIDMVIMPWMYQDSNYYLMKPFIDNNPNVVIINLHQEQIASEASINRMLPTGEHAKNSVVHFVWGNYFKEALLSVGVKENLIYVTGNIRADNSFNTIKDKNVLAAEFGLDSGKEWILFSENRGWILTNNKNKEKHMVYLGYCGQDVIDRKDIAKKSLEATINELNNLDNSFFEKYEFIYRPHPGTTASGNITKRVKIIDEYSINEWINVIDINLVWSSTTIYESDAKGVPSFVYEPIENLARHKTYGLEEYQTISNLNEINKELINDYFQKIAPRKIYERFIGKVDGKSVQRAKEYIVAILNEGINGYKANQIDYDRKMFYKTILFQKLTRLFVRLNLLEKLKYPKSAYELRKDIPYRFEKITRGN